MYTKEQRVAIGPILMAKYKARFGTVTHLAKAVSEALNVKMDPSTTGRVLHGGRYNYEKGRQGDHAHIQDGIVSALAKYFGVDLSEHRASFADAPHLYFPESPAFRPYQKSWIMDCFDVGALRGLLGTCHKAKQGGRTDGHDAERLPIVERAIARFIVPTKAAPTQPALLGAPFEVGPIAHSGSPPMPSQPAPAAGDAPLAAYRALLKQAAALNLPTTEIEQGIIRLLKA